MSGVLSVVATPIGNLDDLSPRAARTLARADIIACEDTRVTRVLLQRVVPDRGHAKLLAVHARNERARVPELVRAVASGTHVALVTDAGMPGLSDPGHHVIEACVEAGLRVEVIPGPSAVPAALVASGLPTARFVFDGFLPRTAGARRRRIEALAPEERTLVIFEAPFLGFLSETTPGWSIRCARSPTAWGHGRRRWRASSRKSTKRSSAGPCPSWPAGSPTTARAARSRS